MDTLSMRLQKGKKQETFSVEINADRFEALAARFGFFSDEFQKSVKRAESDYKNKKCKKVKSLRELA